MAAMTLRGGGALEGFGGQCPVAAVDQNSQVIGGGAAPPVFPNDAKACSLGMKDCEDRPDSGCLAAGLERFDCLHTDDR
jgi:hypothetical protein